MEAQRATFAGAQEFQAAAAQVNANTTALTTAMAGIVGPTKATEFQTAWANHVEGLMAYTAAVAGNDETGKTVAKIRRGSPSGSACTSATSSRTCSPPTR